MIAQTKGQFPPFEKACASTRWILEDLDVLIDVCNEYMREHRTRSHVTQAMRDGGVKALSDFRDHVFKRFNELEVDGL